MKKLSFLALAAVGLLLGACSSDKDEATADASFVGGGDGYVGISISIPSASTGTRANDDLVNGKAEEFAVKNAYLYLFTGSGENDASFLKRYSLTNDWKNDQQGASNTPAAQSGVTFEGGTGITQSSVSVCKIDKPDLGGKKLFAFVVVNAQGGLAAEPAKGTPYSEFAKMQLEAVDRGGSLEGVIGEYGLLMTNSPICDKPGGEEAPADEKISTLVELNASNIKMSEDEAKSNPAGCIYVERATAKVTIAINNSASTLDGMKEVTSDLTASETALPMSLSDVSWQVINTEGYFYNARQVEKAWDPYSSRYYTGHTNTFRFVSLYKLDPKVPGTTGHTTAYRTYFAKDPNYSNGRALNKDVAREDDTTPGGNKYWLGTNDCSYVPENTFDVEHQTRHNTTQVTLRVKFNEGNPFYTISLDNLYYSSTTINKKLAKVAEDLHNVHAWMEKAAQVASASDMFNKTVYVSIKAEVNTSSTGKNDLGYTISYELSDGSNTLTPTDAQRTTIESATTAGGKTWEDVKAEAEQEVTVGYFAGGFAYYNVRIQHYGVQETPWSPTGEYITQPGTGDNGEYTINDIYGSTNTSLRTENFLGRYGVVRDNWYNLSIGTISKLGSAEPLSVKDDPTPDDEVQDEYWISCHVHILPWVLRIQNVSF